MISDEPPFDDVTSALARLDNAIGPGDDDDDDDEVPIGDPPDDDEGDDWDEDDDDDDDEEPLQALFCIAASPPAVHRGTMAPALSRGPRAAGLLPAVTRNP